MRLSRYCRALLALAVGSGHRRKGRLRLFLVPVLAVLGVLGGVATSSVAAQAAGAATTLFVSASGSDTNPCSASAPCATISHSQSLAGSGATIEVAGKVFDNVNISTTVTVEQWPGQSPGIVNGRKGGSVFDVSSTGNLTLDGLTVTGGSSYFGGGIDCGGVNCSITDSTIMGNATAYGYYGGGSGISFGSSYYLPSRPLGTGTITDSTIIDNVTENSRSRGGAVYNTGDTLTITASTITDNTARSGAGGIGLISFPGSATTTIGDTIVANNYSYGWEDEPISAGYTAATYPYHNCDGSFTSVGYNLTSDTTPMSCGFNQATDKVNVDPDLGLLTDNGGSTETMLPPANSPAVGAIPSPTTLNGVPVCGPNALDQRGLARPAPGSTSCAIGAVEPETELTYLQLSVKGVGPGSSLYNKLTQAQDDVAANHMADACGVLDTFVNEVSAQTGKSISNSNAASLIAMTTDVKTVLGC